MDQSAFFGLLQSEAASRQSLAEELLAILRDNEVIDPALEDARHYGGEEFNLLLFGRSDYIPILIPATKFGALRQLVSARPRMLPALDPIRPSDPPPAPAALPAPDPVEAPLDLAGYQIPDAPPPDPLPDPEPEPEPSAPPPLPAIEAPPPPSVPVPASDDTPPAEPPADPEPEPVAAIPAPPAAAPLPPTPVEKTPMSDFGNLNTFSSAPGPGVPMPDGQEQIVMAKCLQKVSTLLHSLMANKDTYSEAVAEAMGIPPSVLDSMGSGKGQDVTLGQAIRVLLYLGAPNVALVIPGPRQAAPGR